MSKRKKPIGTSLNSQYDKASIDKMGESLLEAALKAYVTQSADGVLQLDEPALRESMEHLLSGFAGVGERERSFLIEGVVETCKQKIAQVTETQT